MEGLPHEFYMTNYIKDISEWRNNISKEEYNKSTIAQDNTKFFLGEITTEKNP